jgi:D-glycero-alpha-D-manno-heptose-7-phosphate kinase
MARTGNGSSVGKRVMARAPLRLGLGGGGTDVSPYSDEFGGYVLNATIDQYAYCVLELTDGVGLVFQASDRGEEIRCPAPAQFELSDPLALHKGIYNRIVREFNDGKPLPIKMTTYADVVAGSGLGTSSTMVVAILQAFDELLGLGLGEYDLAHLAYVIEREEVGLSGGKQDQYAAAFGGFNFMEFGGDGAGGGSSARGGANARVIVNPLRVKDWVVNELESSLVLFHTGQSRESARIIDEQRANVKAHNTKSVDAMHQLKRDAVTMKEALLKGDLTAFTACLGKSWEAKKDLAASITNSDIDRIFTAAIGAGAQAGKVSGAGGGGVIMFMVDPARKMDVLRALGPFDGRVINCHFTQRGAESWTR